MQKRIIVTLFGLLLTTFIFSSVDAQSKSVFWKCWDVVIDKVDVTGNSYSVTEKYDIDFTGRFYSGSAVIPYTNLDSITDVAVSESGRALEAQCGSDTAGTFCAETTRDGLSISYYFFRPINDTSEQFQITYQVNGALRIYSGGDQLWWIAIPSDHYGFSIGASTITVVLPEGYASREGIDSVVTYGLPSTVKVQGTTITATANREIVNDEDFEIRVQYPHNPAAEPPKWQPAFDQQRHNDEYANPLVGYGITFIVVLSAIGELLALYSLR